MPSKRKEEVRVTLRNFTRGYAVKASLPGEALQFKNLVFDREFVAVPRNGTTNVSIATGGVCQGMIYANAGGTFNWLFAYNGKLGWAAGVIFPLTPTQVYTGGFTGIAQFLPWGSGAGAYVIVLGVHATGAPQKYTGAAVVVLAGSPPNSTAGAFWGDRLWLADFNTTNRLRFSDSGNPQSWPALNWIDVGIAPEYISSLVETSDALYILTNTSLWQLTGRSTTDFYLRRVAEGMGCNGGNRMAKAIAGSSLTYWSNYRLWTRAGENREMSDPVFPLDPNGQLDWDTAKQYLFVTQTGTGRLPNDATPTYCLLFDAQRKAWYRWELPLINLWYNTIGAGPPNCMMAGTLAGTFVHLADTDEFDAGGAAFDVVLQEQFTDFGMPEVDKYLREITIDGVCAAGAGTVKVHHRMSPSGSYTTVTTSGLTFPVALNYPNTRFNQMSLEVSASTAVNFRYRGAEVGYIPIRRKR